MLTLIAGAVGTLLAAGSITLKPSTARRDNPPAGQTVITASGNFDGFGDLLAGISVYWDVQDASHQQSPTNVSIGQDASDATFVFDLTVPLYESSGGPPVRPGTHNIIVCGDRSFAACVTSVTGTLRIPRPTLSLNKASGRQGDSITIHGLGFSPAALKEKVRVVWDPSGTSILQFEDYPGSSTFDIPVVVPNVPAGTYTIRVCNLPNGTTSAPPCNPQDLQTTQFTILSPIVSLSKASGLAGVPFNISGSRFRPQRTVRLYFGPPGKLPGDPAVVEISPGVAKSTNADGVFGPYPYAPTSAPGSYVVTACTFLRAGCDANDTDTAPYTIVAPPTPSPTPSPSPSPTPTPTPTPTNKPTATPSPTPTPSTTASTPTPTPATSSPTPIPTPSASPTAGITPSPSTSSTSSALPTAATTASPSAEPPSAAPTPTSSANVEPPVDSPTPAPTPSPSAAPTPLMWPQSLSAPGDPGGFGDLATVGAGALLALLIAFLIPFPGTLFNKTVEANYSEIQGWIKGARDRWNGLLDSLAVGPLGAVRRRLGRAVVGRTGVLLFLALSALVYGFLSPSFGFDLNSAALFLGLLVGLACITAAFDLPLRLYHGRRTKARDGGVLRALWWTLAVAVICVAISRLAGFQPGYLYGLIISIVFVTGMTTRDEGIGVWLASVWLLVLSVVAWVLLAIVREQSADPWLTLFLQTVLVTFVVAGIETLVIGLLPMRFLPGLPLFRWRKSMWFALFALSVFGYLMILVDPANGYLSDESRTPMIVGVIFLVVFGMVSIGTWAYFRFRPARVSGGCPGEA